jgi:SPP1 gp7 family putative phage head morphogenesis protein
VHDHLHTHATVADKQTRARVASGKLDPTKTALVRRKFEADLRRRFSVLLGLIRSAIVDDDGFGLVTGTGIIGIAVAQVVGARTTIANRRQFDFPRSTDKVRSFMAWLRSQESKEILSVAPGIPIEAAAQTAWSNLYIDTAYRRGIRQSVGQLQKAGASVSDRWVSSAFLRPVHADRVGLIYTRTYSGLAGITQSMDARISRVLSLALAEGQSPRQIARDLNREVDIGLNRARMIARTEVISAHAESSLNTYQEAGVLGVGVEAEWLTTGDGLVCELCEELAGKELTIEEARNMLPRHPNCRCAWIPKIEDARGLELR